MGYAPMESVEFMDISPLASQQLSMNFPFFFMIIYLIPFYYLVSKIASEKESKAREGMKMMGLTDGTYYLSWFIFYFGICFTTSLIVASMCRIGVF
jgi:ATP-binding cassette subfamily A (ABC1) protein 3